MSVQKVKVDSSKRGKITCPKCGREKTINAVSFRMNHDIKVTCECKHVYYIRFDQRRHSRKKVNLKGRFQKIDEKSPQVTHVEITNISMSGLSFKTKDVANLQAGDDLALAFILNNQRQPEIKTKATIRYVKENQVGIKFDHLDETDQDVLNDYFSASISDNENANLRRELRLREEARCISVAKQELKKYGSTVGVSFHVDFSGGTWDEAVQSFRNSWANRHICSHCHAVTDSETASKAQFKCRRCVKGRYTSSPKEIWDIILTQSPHRERYFTLNDAVSTFAVDLTEFKSNYPYGFFVPILKDLYDNTLIAVIKNVLDECRNLGISLTEDHIAARKVKKNIRIIRKRNYNYHPEKIIIGRSVTSDIVFDNEDVSRTHAYVYCDMEKNECYLVDNGSANGTFLNKKRITPNQPSILSDNDEITFGPQARVIYFSPAGFYNFLQTMAAKEDKSIGSSRISATQESG
jgi:FHA domain/PilZ domain